MTIRGRTGFRRWAAWLGLIALLLHAVMPVAQALAAAPDELTFPAACVAHADEAAPTNSADPAAPEPFADCALCVVHCAAAPAMPAEAGVAAPLLRHGERLALAAVADRLDHAHPELTYPRGPPQA